MRTQNCGSARYAGLIVLLAFLVGWGILAVPSRGLAQNETGGVSVLPLVHGMIHGMGMNGLSAAALHAVAKQDAGQSASPAATPSSGASSSAASPSGAPPTAATPATAPAQPQPVFKLPEGDGKAVVLDNCQDCHTLKILPKMHKSVDGWKNTVQTMIDNGADIPADKIDTLVQYLARNFGPKSAPTAAGAQAAPVTPAPMAVAPPGAPPLAPPLAPVQAKAVNLPDGDGKAIATQKCQACHSLTTVTTARMDLGDWKDTVQTMIDRGANVPADKIDTLVQYLARNFAPKPADTPARASGTSSTATQAQ